VDQLRRGGRIEVERRRVDDLTKGVIAGLWGLLVLGLIVGAFAIANTLTMNVLEQTRELALLRVVATATHTREQLDRALDIFETCIKKVLKKKTSALVK